MGVSPGKMRSDKLGILAMSLNGLMSISPGKMKRDQRRELRNFLRVELTKVQGLFSKLEERESQLRSMYQSGEEIYPSLSDAEVSRISPHEDGVHGRDSATASNELFAPMYDLHSPETDNPCLDGQSSPTSIMPPEVAVAKVGAETASQRNPNSTMPPEAGLAKIGAETASRCYDVLKKLMKHKYGWIFNQPVDAIALKIWDYHRVVRKPMDLGTVKSKLDGHQYDSPEEFANDVRLTFSNAMLYNPQGHKIHEVADKLLRLFESNWESIQMNLDHETNQDIGRKIVQSSSSSTRIISSEIPDTTKDLRKPESSSMSDAPTSSNEPGREMSFEEKVVLVGSLQLLPVHMQDDVVRFMRQRNPALDQKVDEMEVDVDSFSNMALWELDQYVKDCLKAAGVSTKMLVQSSQQKGRTDMDHERVDREKGGCWNDDVGNAPLQDRTAGIRPWS